MASKIVKDSKLPKIAYTLEEEDWLVKNALIYRDIIENKKTDGATKRDKDIAWEKITKAFNVAPPCQKRNNKSLREKYTKITQNLKNRVFYHANDAKKTGGGPPKKELPPLSEAMQELFAILIPSTVGLSAATGDSDLQSTSPSAPQTHHDGNGEPNGTGQSIGFFINEELIFLNDEAKDTNCIDKDVSDTVVANKSNDIEIAETDLIFNNTCAWDRVNPAKLRKPKNSLLQNSRHRQILENDTASKVPKMSEEKLLLFKEKRQEIEIEILEIERVRYGHECKRAAIDIERAELEKEKAELDRQRSAVELQRTRNQIEFEKELQRVRLAAFHKGTQFEEVRNEMSDPIFLTAAAKKQYLN